MWKCGNVDVSTYVEYVGHVLRVGYCRVDTSSSRETLINQGRNRKHYDIILIIDIFT